MAFVEVGNDQGSGNRSPIQKWNSVGQTVEGVYRGQRNGKFGPLTVVQTDSGEMVYGTKAVLGRKLADAFAKLKAGRFSQDMTLFIVVDTVKPHQLNIEDIAEITKFDRGVIAPIVSMMVTAGYFQERGGLVSRS